MSATGLAEDGDASIWAPNAGMGGGEITVEAWFRTDAGTPQNLLFLSDSLWLKTADGCIMNWCHTLACPPGRLDDGQWHFVAATAFTGNGGESRVYVDGQPFGAGSCDGFALASRVYFGALPTSAPFPLLGELDEVRVLDFVAPGLAVTDFDAGVLEPIDGSVGLWHFDESPLPGCCPSGSTCASGGCALPGDAGTPFCPSSAPVRCSDGTSQCGCPAGTLACGDFCCGAGETCADGACRPVCPDPAFPTACGESCCAAGIACTGGACLCPNGYPITCGEECCPSGASCTGGQCGCPGGEEACGAVCCASGESCVGGSCQQPSNPSGCPTYDDLKQFCPHGEVCIPDNCRCPAPLHDQGLDNTGNICFRTGQHWVCSCD